MLIEVDVEKTLTSRGRSFSLRVAFASDDHRVVLFGPSGSGKSLTLQSVAGLVRPDSGRISLKGRILFDAATGIDIPSRSRNLGYLFQDYALFPHLTVAQNVGYGLKKTGPWPISKKDHRGVLSFLDTLEIGNIAESFPADLSGGQRQRVALARALIRRPALLLLDEPFSAVDTLLKGKLRKELLDIQARFHVPMIMITHDPEDIEVFAESLVTFEAGRACGAFSSTKSSGQNERAVFGNAPYPCPTH